MFAFGTQTEKLPAGIRTLKHSFNRFWISRKVKCSKTCDEYILCTLSLGKGNPMFKSQMMSLFGFVSSVTHPFRSFLSPAPISKDTPSFWSRRFVMYSRHSVCLECWSLLDLIV